MRKVFTDNGWTWAVYLKINKLAEDAHRCYGLYLPAFWKKSFNQGYLVLDESPPLFEVRDNLAWSTSHGKTETFVLTPISDHEAEPHNWALVPIPNLIELCAIYCGCRRLLWTALIQITAHQASRKPDDVTLKALEGLIVETIPGAAFKTLVSAVLRPALFAAMPTLRGTEQERALYAANKSCLGEQALKERFAFNTEQMTTTVEVVRQNRK